MTDVRLVRRTHYQVLEPALLRLLIQSFTSAVSSDFPDRVARRLAATKDDLNVVAANYVVDLAKALNLVNGNLVWTNLGHLLHVVASNAATATDMQLTELERLVFFRLFLEFDGAAVLFFAKKIEKQDEIPGPGESWTEISQELFESTYEEYLQFVTDPEFRTRLRHLAERRRQRPFRGKSGPHQSWVHIHTLYRLQLVEKIEHGATRTYKARSVAHCGLRPTAKLIDVVPDLMALEKLVNARTCYELASEVLGMNADSGQNPSDLEFAASVRSVYDRVMAAGVALCPIQTLAEVIQVQSVVERRQPLGMENILLRLKEIQRRAPDKMRFHVDRTGRPAFIKMD